MTAVEICIDDVAGATIAEECGADRVEVCAALSEGGTTPSIGLVSTVLAEVSRIGVQVLIRPRAGDFVYSPAEVDVMLADIAAVRALPASAQVGFVVGALTAEGAIDTAVLSRLVTAAGRCPVTFHRAFDTLPDLPAALPVLISAGVSRVLTSGGAPTAAAGAAMLRSLVELAGDRITVLAGGSVRGSNVAPLVAETGVPEVHLRAASPVVSSAAGSATGVDYAVPRLATSPGPIRAVLEALAS